MTRYLMKPHPTNDKKVEIVDRVEQVSHFVLKSHVNVVVAWHREVSP